MTKSFEGETPAQSIERAEARNATHPGLSLQAKAVFLDRDGVLTVPEFREGRSYAPRRLEDFRLYAGVLGATTRLKRAGFLLVVVTNQLDVEAGLLAPEVLAEMHRRIAAQLPVDAIEVCCHRREAGCDYRKPASGMLRRAAARFGIDYRRSFMVGDRASDVAAGRAVGCRTIFIDLDDSTESPPEDADFTASSLTEAAALILREAEAASDYRRCVEPIRGSSADPEETVRRVMFAGITCRAERYRGRLRRTPPPPPARISYARAASRPVASQGIHQGGARSPAGSAAG